MEYNIPKYLIFIAVCMDFIILEVNVPVTFSGT
jgi:hypothetical protein